MSEQINIGDIIVYIQKKRVRNLSLRVTPPDGSVKATVPIGMRDDKALAFIRSKELWIRRQQSKIQDNSFYSVPDYKDGEEHYLFGKVYPLELRETFGREGVALADNKILLYCKSDSDKEKREKILEKWYKENLLNNLPSVIRKWESIMGLSVKEYRVRKMSTRWGSCNPRARRIWFSLMLAKRRPELIEYIVVHEMVHFMEASHNKRFYSIMASYLPDWKELRSELR